MNFFPGALLILAISWLTVHQVESIPSGNEGICSLPCEVGPCKAAFERWYYDNKIKSCKEFIYGGCEGNMNNFESFDACQHTCSEGSEEVQSAGADSQAEDTAKVFNELIEKDSNPGALKVFFPEKRGQHLLPRLLSPRSRQKEVKESQMEQTKETYRKLDRVGVHPEDMRPFFTSGQRVRRENPGEGFPITPKEIESLAEEGNNQPEDPSESSSTMATTTAAAATSSSVSTALAPSITTSGTQTTSESTTKSVSTSLAKTTSSPAVKTTAEVTASPSAPITKTSVKKEAKAKTTASPALISKTSTSSTVAKTTLIDGAGAGAGAGVVTTTSSTLAETQSTTTVAETQSTTTTTTTTTTDRSSSTKTPSTTSQSTSTNAPDQGGDTKTSSTSSSSSASSSYETTTFTESSTSVSPTTTTIASSSTAVWDGSNPDESEDMDSNTSDGSDNSLDYDNSDIHRRKYQLHEHTSSHFAAFFLSSIVLVFAVYIAYHNRQRIIAVIIEGRSENRRRPGNYRKLETNVEEAMPSMRSTNSAYVY